MATCTGQPLAVVSGLLGSTLLPGQSAKVRSPTFASGIGPGHRDVLHHDGDDVGRRGRGLVDSLRRRQLRHLLRAVPVGTGGGRRARGNRRRADGGPHRPGGGEVLRLRHHLHHSRARGPRWSARPSSSAAARRPGSSPPPTVRPSPPPPSGRPTRTWSAGSPSTRSSRAPETVSRRVPPSTARAGRAGLLGQAPSGARRAIRASGPVGGLGRSGLVRPQQVGHDPQDPAHQRLGVHAGPHAQPHELGPADHADERPGHPVVEAVGLLEPGLVTIRAPRPATRQGLAQRGRGQPAGLVAVGDPLPVERVDRTGGVAHHQRRGSDPRVRRPGPSGSLPPVGGPRQVEGRAPTPSGPRPRSGPSASRC